MTIPGYKPSPAVQELSDQVDKTREEFITSVPSEFPPEIVDLVKSIITPVLLSGISIGAAWAMQSEKKDFLEMALWMWHRIAEAKADLAKAPPSHPSHCH